MGRLRVCVAIVLCLAMTSSAFAERSDEEQARKHYRVALEALKNNDLEIAAEELRKAAELAPNNALILYNLAVVQSKQGDAQKALKNVQRALELGLPQEGKEAAEELEAQMTFKVKKQTEVLRSLVGKWIRRVHFGMVETRTQCTADSNSIKDNSITLACNRQSGPDNPELFSYTTDPLFPFTLVIKGVAGGEFQCTSPSNKYTEKLTIINEDSFICGDASNGKFIRQ